MTMIVVMRKLLGLLFLLAARQQAQHVVSGAIVSNPGVNSDQSQPHKPIITVSKSFSLDRPSGQLLDSTTVAWKTSPSLSSSSSHKYIPSRVTCETVTGKGSACQPTSKSANGDGLRRPSPPTQNSKKMGDDKMSMKKAKMPMGDDKMPMKKAKIPAPTRRFTLPPLSPVSTDGIINATAVKAPKFYISYSFPGVTLTPPSGAQLESVRIVTQSFFDEVFVGIYGANASYIRTNFVIEALNTNGNGLLERRQFDLLLTYQATLYFQTTTDSSTIPSPNQVAQVMKPAFDVSQSYLPRVRSIVGFQRTRSVAFVWSSATTMPTPSAAPSMLLGPIENTTMVLLPIFYILYDFPTVKPTRPLPMATAELENATESFFDQLFQGIYRPVSGFIVTRVIIDDTAIALTGLIPNRLIVTYHPAAVYFQISPGNSTVLPTYSQIIQDMKEAIDISSTYLARVRSIFYFRQLQSVQLLPTLEGLSQPTSAPESSSRPPSVVPTEASSAPSHAPSVSVVPSQAPTSQAPSMTPSDSLPGMIEVNVTDFTITYSKLRLLGKPTLLEWEMLRNATQSFFAPLFQGLYTGDPYNRYAASRLFLGTVTESSILESGVLVAHHTALYRAVVDFRRSRRSDVRTPTSLELAQALGWTFQTSNMYLTLVQTMNGFIRTSAVAFAIVQ